ENLSVKASGVLALMYLVKDSGLDVSQIDYLIEHIMSGKLNNFMVIGKGSLFLGRMTNLFDGVSILVEKNDGGKEENTEVSKDEVKKIIAREIRKFAQQLMDD
ncbi:DUF5940 domain-containing protein, partial [Muricomes intestini]|uniref:DUF5940 domain-containing protein n=1 Tax=Muricomes intestini TaxID=1796634 RepID=UPI002FE1CCF4